MDSPPLHSIEPPVNLDHHGAQDYQSLLMHVEAVRLLNDDPGLVERAVATLARWRETADPRSYSLLDEWSGILERRDGNLAVARTERRALVESCGLHEVQRERVPRDCEECLRVLLGRKVRIYRRRDGRVSSNLLKVVEVVRELADPNGDVGEREALSQQLQDFGMRLMMNKRTATWQLVVCSSPNHDGMRRMMQGTDWAKGGLKDVLMRLPGAKYTSVRVAKACERVVIVDLGAELFVESDEDCCGVPMPNKTTNPESAQAGEAKGE